MLKKIGKRLIKNLSPDTRAGIMRYLISMENSNPITRVELQSIHTEGCQVIPDRMKLIHRLKGKSARVAELGVDKGDFSMNIINGCQPKELVLIDHWEDDETYNYVMERFESFPQVKVLRSNAVKGLQTFPDHYFDWVYIDTSHSYEGTKEELYEAARKVKDEGLICGHDYTQGNWPERLKYGVIEAVHEFCVDQGFSIKYLTLDPNCHRSFALQRIKGS